MALLFTAISILVSISALVYSWYKDRILRQKEYADRVRRAASYITAKLERWRELSLRFFEDIQPLITDSDGLLLKERDVLRTRDFLWRGLVVARAESSRRILDEQIEIAYADLYGYDARVRDLFTSAVQRLKEIDDNSFSEVLRRTQADVLTLKAAEKVVQSATLGNALRQTTADIASRLAILLDAVISSFRREMMRLIEATDSQIVGKLIEIDGPERIFQHVNITQEAIPEMLRRILYFELDLNTLQPMVLTRKGTSMPRAYRAGGEVIHSVGQHKKRQVSAASLVSAKELGEIVHSDPNIMGGTPVFAGTRVPLQNLVDYLEAGSSVDDFIEAFPTVKRDHIRAVIEAGKKKITGAS